MTTAARWWTEHRWATHGSKLQTQLYVSRRSETLVPGTCGSLRRGAAGRLNHDLVELDITLEAQWREDRAVGIVEML